MKKEIETNLTFVIPVEEGRCEHIHKDDPQWAICEDCWIKEHKK
jgi:hypothetical protein